MSLAFAPARRRGLVDSFGLSALSNFFRSDRGEVSVRLDVNGGNTIKVINDSDSANRTASGTSGQPKVTIIIC